MPRRLLSVALTAALLLVIQAGVVGRCWSGPFTVGDLVVVRVGDGANSLTSATAQVFLDEFNPTTGTLVQSIQMPTTVSGADRAFTLGGNSVSEGYLSRSVDGRYLTLAGYDAGTGAQAAGSIPSAFDGTTDRVVARVDASGTVNTSTVLTNAYSGDSVRSATTVDGSQYWVSGASRVNDPGANTGGVYVIDHGATTGTRLSSDLNNTRTIAIFNNQLYVSSGSGSNAAVNTVGTGLPTTAGQTIAPVFLTTGNTGSGATPNSFVILDLNHDGIADRAYVADDRINGAGGLQKWTSTNGTDWTLETTFSPANSTGLRGLTCEVVDGNPVLFATTSISGNSSGNSLVSFTDDGSNTSFVTLATAGDLTTFRGVAFAPSAIPEPGSFALAGLGVLGLAYFSLRRRHHGQTQ